MLGLWPMTGQTTFLILSPWFEQMIIDLGGDKTLVISTSGSDRINAPYIQSLKVNGKSWNKSWVSWDDIFANGGTRDFVLGANKTGWSMGDLPPSPASGEIVSVVR
jgi:putative alpha-1,2-mannosidase